jgi:hypothetical protein
LIIVFDHYVMAFCFIAKLEETYISLASILIWVAWTLWFVEMLNFILSHVQHLFASVFKCSLFLKTLIISWSFATPCLGIMAYTNYTQTRPTQLVSRPFWHVWIYYMCLEFLKCWSWNNHMLNLLWMCLPKHEKNLAARVPSHGTTFILHQHCMVLGAL